MSHEHDAAPSSHDEASISDRIRPEPAPFEASYQPGTVPQISMPDLPADVQGLTADALAQVPTLTDCVEEVSVLATLTESTEIAAAPKAPSALALDAEPELLAQDTPTQADTWGEELQARMGKLTDEIHILNARLDRLEEKNKAKA